jgi:hypothetical protein
MVHEGDVPMIGEDLELFSLRTIQRIAEKSRQKALAAACAVKGEKIGEYSDIKYEQSEIDEEISTSSEEDMDMEDDATEEKKATDKGIEIVKMKSQEMMEEDDGLDGLLDDEEDEEEEGKRKKYFKKIKYFLPSLFLR